MQIVARVFLPALLKHRDVLNKKRMGATYVGVRRAHPYSWLLSSPQQPLETEDPPTVSLAPQYTSQRVCRASSFYSTLIDVDVYCVKAIAT